MGARATYFSKAVPWRVAFRSHCACDRSGKWKTSIGYQPLSGANGLSTSAWFPRVTWISGCARWTTLRIGLKSDAGSLIGASAEKRTVIRSAKLPVTPVRGRPERAQERADGPVALGNRVQHVAKRRPSRPPELVGVGVDHPVRSEVGRSQACHARHPFVLAQILAGLSEQMHVTFARVALEHLRRPVLRAVVGRDHEVGARVQVEGEPRLDHVRLVAGEQRHDELHRRASLWRTS